MIVSFDVPTSRSAIGSCATNTPSATIAIGALIWYRASSRDGNAQATKQAATIASAPVSSPSTALSLESVVDDAGVRLVRRPGQDAREQCSAGCRVADLGNTVRMGEERRRRGPLDRLTNLVPVDAVMRNIDIDAVLDRIDMDALLARIDVNAVAARLDLDEVVERMDLGAIVQRSVRGATTGTLHEVRSSGVRLDRWITGLVDRLLRRPEAWRPAQPVASKQGSTS